jgi:UDPglucose 6-dehydrogenase
MNIGIIGRGVVGDAVFHGLQQVGNHLLYYDANDSSTTINDVIKCDIVFVCVPTLSAQDGNCDTSIVIDVVDQLDKLSYVGIVAVKSTVIPGTTDWLINKYSNLKICHVPEFLRQKSAHSDFFDNHEVLIIGTHDLSISSQIIQSHRYIPKSISVVKPVEAEITKYFNNVHNAMEVVFANVMHEMCEKLGADYQEVLMAIGKKDNINTSYLKCSQWYKGFAGVCLPKDTLAWKQLAKNLQINVELFDTILKDNERYLK